MPNVGRRRKVLPPADMAASHGGEDYRQGLARFGAAVSVTAAMQHAREIEAQMPAVPELDDTLPRVRVRPVGRAVAARLQTSPADTLADLYDPDAITRQFYKPVADYEYLAYAPVKDARGSWIQPLGSHRIQVPFQEREALPGGGFRWRLRWTEHIIRRAEDLAALALTPEYRRARFAEATGEWRMKFDAGDYKRLVERDARAFHAHAVTTTLRQLKESSFDTYSFEPSVTSPTDVMGQINQEYIPITGGPYCFAGDTKIALLDGTEKTIAELAETYAGRSFEVYAVTPRGEVVPARAHSAIRTGVQEKVVEVELDNGERVRCTPTHLWMLRDGSYRKAAHLKPGDSLMPLYRRISTKGLPGYRMVFQPTLNRYVYEHKSFTGRVPKGFVVHHQNFIKTDNRPENLRIMARADHQRLHMDNCSWWNDPVKRSSAVAKISVALKRNNWMRTPEGRAFVSQDVRRRYANGERHWRIGHRGWLSERQRNAVINNDLRRRQTAEANRCRVWTPEMRAKVAASLRAYYTQHEQSEAGRAALELGRSQRRLNHTVVSVRPAGTADVYDFTVDEYHNFALSAGVFVHNSRQLYMFAHWEQTAKAFEMRHHSELAKAAIGIISDFVLGRGVTWKIRNDKVRTVWEEFWKRNDMEARLRVLSDDTTWQGELLLRMYERPKGFLVIRSLDPGAFTDIVTDPQDVEAVHFYSYSAPCLTGDTRIALLDGTNPTIAELAEQGEPQWVYSYDHETKRIVPGKATKIFKTGVKRCVRVTLDNDEAVTASYDHPFLLRNGEYRWAEQLQPGDSLMPLYRRMSYEDVWQPETGWERTHHMVSGKPVKGSHVHHINTVKTDNRPENLVMMDSAEHNQMHRRSTRRALARTSAAFNPSPAFVVQQSSSARLDWWEKNQHRRAMQSEDMKRRWQDPEERKRRTEAIRRVHQAQWQDPEIRKRRSEAIRRGKARRRELGPPLPVVPSPPVFSDTERAARSERLRQRWATNPDELISGMKVYWSDPQHRAKQSVAAIESWKNPVKRAARVDAAAEVWKDSERRAERIAKGTLRKRETMIPRREELAKASALKNHKVVSVVPVGEHEVYDLQVDEYHNFALTVGVFTHNSPWQMVSQFRGHNLHIPGMQYVIQQYPPHEMLHLKNNVSSTEKWGRSDFFTSLGTLKRHRDWTNAATLKDMLQANLIWKIKIHGDQADVDAFAADSNNAQLPAFGGTWLENEAVELSEMHEDVAGSSRMQGSTGQFLTALFATAMNMPVSYFNIGTAGTARATALTQGEPFVKKIATRQQRMRQLLDRLFVEVMERAVAVRRLDGVLLRSEEADPEWIFPSTYEEDRSAKFRDLSTARDRSVISHQTEATQMAQELGLAEYNYEEEQLAIAEERRREGIASWPLDTEIGVQLGVPPKGAEPPPMPPGMFGAPGQEPGMPGATPGDELPSGEEIPKPDEVQGRGEELKGADERSAFRRAQVGHAKQSELPETDQRFLEAMIDKIKPGESVVLPSGRVAKIREAA